MDMTWPPSVPDRNVKKTRLPASLRGAAIIVPSRI
jgi:hypothetical protein